MTEKYISDKVREEFGGDPRVVASLTRDELREVQNSVKDTNKPREVVMLPSRRSVFPRYEGMGNTTDANY